jgi:uncharacterized membrane protein YjjB (DUF3815 family)
VNAFLDTLWIVLRDAGWSGLAALGFAMLFNVPTRTLSGCTICGAVGHGLRTLLMEVGFTIASATLISATAVGFMGWAFARRWRAPTPVFTVSGAIVLVPGVFAYQTMISLVQLTTSESRASDALLTEASVNGIKTMLILGAIAVGITAPSLIFERNRPAM